MKLEKTTLWIPMKKLNWFLLEKKSFCLTLLILMRILAQNIRMIFKEKEKPARLGQFNFHLWEREAIQSKNLRSLTHYFKTIFIIYIIDRIEFRKIR